MEHMGAWLMSVTGVILVAEIVAGRHRGIYDRHEMAVVGLCFSAGLLIRPFFAVGVAKIIGFVLPQWQGAAKDVPFAIALPVIMLSAEFANYWVHRTAHQMKDGRHFDWLWRLHRTHHSAGYINVLVNSRINIFWGFFAGLTWVILLAIYLGQGLAAAVTVIFFSLWSIVTHSHFRWDDRVRAHRYAGPVFRMLEHVLVSPGMHHSHHGYGKDGGNYRNFGCVLAIFDWMFGTLYIPRGRPFRYGIPGARPHWAEDAFFPLYRKRAKSPETAEAS